MSVNDTRLTLAVASLIANPNPQIHPDGVTIEHLRAGYSNDELELLADLTTRLGNAIEHALCLEPLPREAGPR